MSGASHPTPDQRTYRCPCMGPIPQGVALPCDHFLPDDDPGGDPRDCDNCGHREECHL